MNAAVLLAFIIVFTHLGSGCVLYSPANDTRSPSRRFYKFVLPNPQPTEQSTPAFLSVASQGTPVWSAAYAAKRIVHTYEVGRDTATGTIDYYVLLADFTLIRATTNINRLYVPPEGSLLRSNTTAIIQLTRPSSASMPNTVPYSFITTARDDALLLAHTYGISVYSKSSGQIIVTNWADAAKYPSAFSSSVPPVSSMAFETPANDAQASSTPVYVCIPGANQVWIFNSIQDGTLLKVFAYVPRPISIQMSFAIPSRTLAIVVSNSSGVTLQRQLYFTGTVYVYDTANGDVLFVASQSIARTLALSFSPLSFAVEEGGLSIIGADPNANGLREWSFMLADTTQFSMDSQSTFYGFFPALNTPRAVIASSTAISGNIFLVVSDSGLSLLYLGEDQATRITVVAAGSCSGGLGCFTGELSSYSLGITKIGAGSLTTHSSSVIQSLDKPFYVSDKSGYIAMINASVGAAQYQFVLPQQNGTIAAFIIIQDDDPTIVPESVYSIASQQRHLYIATFPNGTVLHAGCSTQITTCAFTDIATTPQIVLRTTSGGYFNASLSTKIQWVRTSEFNALCFLIPSSESIQCFTRTASAQQLVHEPSLTPPSLGACKPVDMDFRNGTLLIMCSSASAHPDGAPVVLTLATPRKSFSFMYVPAPADCELSYAPCDVARGYYCLSSGKDKAPPLGGSPAITWKYYSEQTFNVTSIPVSSRKRRIESMKRQVQHQQQRQSSVRSSLFDSWQAVIIDSPFHTGDVAIVHLPGMLYFAPIPQTTSPPPLPTLPPTTVVTQTTSPPSTTQTPSPVPTSTATVPANSTAPATLPPSTEIQTVPPPPSDTNNDEEDASAGYTAREMTEIAVGIIVALLFCCVVLWACTKRKRTKKPQSNGSRNPLYKPNDVELSDLNVTGDERDSLSAPSTVDTPHKTSRFAFPVMMLAPWNWPSICKPKKQKFLQLNIRSDEDAELNTGTAKVGARKRSIPFELSYTEQIGEEKEREETTYTSGSEAEPHADPALGAGGPRSTARKRKSDLPGKEDK
jgi:hypothetical protein